MTQQWLDAVSEALSTGFWNREVLTLEEFENIQTWRLAELEGKGQMSV